MSPGNPIHHLTSPVLASIDIGSTAIILAFWTDFLSHPIGSISTALAGLWYGFCLVEAIKQKFKK